MPKLAEHRPKTEVPPGTLEMLILKTLARCGPLHGYGIAKYIKAWSEDVLQIEEGSLYELPIECSSICSSFLRAASRFAGNHSDGHRPSVGL